MRSSAWPSTYRSRVGPTIAVTGSIREISPEADSTTGTYQVKVTLPSPPPEMRLGAVVVGRVESEGQEVTSLPSDRPAAVRRPAAGLGDGE